MAHRRGFAALAHAAFPGFLVGNTVATFVLAKWEKAFDQDKFDAYMAALASGTELVEVPAKDGHKL